MCVRERERERALVSVSQVEKYVFGKPIIQAYSTYVIDDQTIFCAKGIKLNQ